MKLFDEFLDLLIILTPVIVMPVIAVCIAIAWFSSHKWIIIEPRVFHVCTILASECAQIRHEHITTCITLLVVVHVPMGTMTARSVIEGVRELAKRKKVSILQAVTANSLFCLKTCGIRLGATCGP